MSGGIFGLASRHEDWLAQRRVVLTNNIANANTPGFKARDIAAFDDRDTGLRLSATDPRHMRDMAGAGAIFEVDGGASGEALHSGNTVDLDQELMRANEVTRSHAVTTAITKSFHRLFMMTTKV